MNIEISVKIIKKYIKNGSNAVKDDWKWGNRYL